MGFLVLEVREMTEVKGLIARHRGEVIVRRWHDEVADLRDLLRRYHEHVCTCAPLSWASHGDGEYAEQAHDWEQEWAPLKEEVEKELLKD